MQSLHNSKQKFISLATRILRRIERSAPDAYWWHEVRALSHDLNFVRLGLGTQTAINSNFNRPVFYVSEVWRDSDGCLSTTSGTELLYGVRKWFDAYRWISHATTVMFSGCDPEDEDFSMFVPLDVSFDAAAHDLASPDTTLLYECEHPLPHGAVQDPDAMADIRLQVIKCLHNWIDAVELLPTELELSPETAQDASKKRIETPDPLNVQTEAAEPGLSGVQEAPFFYGDIRKRIDCDTDTIRTRATACGLPVPRRGERNLRYTKSQLLSLLTKLSGELQQGEQRLNASKWIDELNASDRS
jgi:hypothetical protein